MNKIVQTILILLLLSPSQLVIAGEKTVTLAVENMSCVTCPITVRMAISKVEGVETVKVDFEKREALVIFDDELTTTELLAAASTNAGFPAKLKVKPVE